SFCGNVYIKQNNVIWPIAIKYYRFYMISIHLKRLILSTAFISLVYIFLQEDINNISRLLEKYKDTPSSLNLSAYSVVI
ncbi:hypothetical protein OFN09_34380, partial [Escherichia coli]|nr:hypothetical protein [Escherichia coli]